MHKQRHIVANMLLAVLVYGGLLAPLHHTINMALGGFYSGGEHHTEEMSCHEVAEVPLHGERYVPQHEGHPDCPFMELFTISLLSYKPVAYTASTFTHNAIQSFGTPVFYWQDTTQRSYYLRGPPLG